MFASKAAVVCSGSAGMPVGVQVVGKPFADETVPVLRVVKLLERTVGPAKLQVAATGL